MVFELNNNRYLILQFDEVITRTELIRNTKSRRK